MGLVNGNTFVGSVTGTATSTTVNLGFTPSYVSTENETSGTGYENFGGTSKTKKTVSAGTKTFETAATTGLIIVTGGFTVVSSASDVINYKAIR